MSRKLRKEERAIIERLRKTETEKKNLGLAIWRSLVTMTKVLQTYHAQC